MANKFGYECIGEVFTDGGARLCKYKSIKTGLSVCIAEIDGPLISGYLCLATEAHDNDGLAHTLEHLIFLGSENYPYKGVLDLLANRCLAHGTNAWTDTDHTCYTMCTAGSEGFLTLLPIYVEHLLYPTLTDEAYATEVHHINGEGEDAGVVYCEMQSCENTGESLCYRAMLLDMYPGVCGYNAEQGGRLKNLRESTSNEKVKEFHKKFYRPENLCIIIVGNIQPHKVFESLQPLEARIFQDDPKEPFVRPWQTPIPPLVESITRQVEYPSDEDDSGMVIASWRGPLATDYEDLVALEVLMDYMTDTSVSPFQRELVENDDPVCNDVEYSLIVNSVSCIYLHLSNVPMEKFNEIKDKVFSVFENIANGTEELDMKRMATVIKKKKLCILNAMEDGPHEHLASPLIVSFLYGDGSLKELQVRLQEIPLLEKMCLESPNFWLNLLKKFIVGKNYVLILGKPSIPLSESMTEEERNRIKAQKENLGSDGLKEKAQILTNSVLKNGIPAPKEIITSVSVPSLNSINFHPIQSICNMDDERSDIGFAIEKMPCRFYLNHFNTNFVRFVVYMDTSELSADLRMYLPLFVELLDESSIERNGEIIPYQEVVKELESDTVHISTNLGLSSNRFFCGSYAQAIFLKFTVTEDKYCKSVQWIKDMLYNIVFKASRVRSIVKKIINDLPSLKREASCVSKTVLQNIVFQKESNHWVASMFRQGSFLNTVLKMLDSNPDQVIENLNELRRRITTPNKMAVHLSLNLNNFKQKLVPEEPWIKDLFPSDHKPSISHCSVNKCCDLLLPSFTEGPSGIIVGLSAVQTANLVQCAPCLNSYTHEDYAPLLLLVQYITQSEGLIWKKVRGTGLAYDSSISFNPLTGLIYLYVSESTHLVKAYESMVEVLESFLKREIEWDTEMMVSAKSSLMFERIEMVKTVADVAYENLKYSFNYIGVEFNHYLLEKISTVSIKDMERVASKYFQPLIDAAQSRCSVCCHPDKIKEIIDGFQKFSRNLIHLSSFEDDLLTAF